MKQEKKNLSIFKSNIFPLKKLTPEPTLNPTVFDTPKPTKMQSKKSKYKISPLKLF